EELFHEVADLSAETRGRYFEDRGIGEITQRGLQELFLFDSPSRAFLKRQVGHIAELALAGMEPAGVRCGPYQLRSLLGRGGMGTVYLAERVDGEVTQPVAVKLLQPGADSAHLRQRFLAERQILAALSHPN